ncbi:MAG: hypothetical protein L0Y39_09140 [Methylococcaceae bacterium]|nr:hypothetical protein [Methylococcaceae bacterium]
MTNRLQLFDDVFLEILLGLALALLVVVAFAPRIVGLCDGGRADFTEIAPTTVTGRDFTEPSQIQAYPPQIEKCKPGFFSWINNRHWNTLILWVLLCFFCIKLVHESSVMRYHRKPLEEYFTDPGMGGNFILFCAKIALLASLYLFIIFKYVEGSSKVSDTAVAISFFVLVLSSYFFPNLTLYDQLRSAIITPPDPSLHRRQQWLAQVAAVWLSLDLVNIIFLWAILTQPYLPLFFSKGVSFVFIALFGVVVVELFAPTPVVTWHRLRPWLQDIRGSSGGFRFWLCMAIIAPPAYVTFGLDLSDVQPYGIVYLISVNLFDWYLNRHFFFGSPP